MKVMFAGSFNPPTTGHIDIIKTAAKLFDEVVVCLMPNPEKKYGLSAETRAEMINKCLTNTENAKAIVGKGLTAEYAKSIGCGALLRGIRNTTDFEFEKQLADANRAVFGIETVFIPTKPELGYISSTIIRDVLRNGGDAVGLVPDEIMEEVKQYYCRG